MSSRESYTSVINRKAAAKQLMNVAMGRERADLVLKNAVYVNVFTNELSQGDIAVKNGVIAGIGHYDGVEELDMQGKIVAPGLIDAHIHLESSLVAPSEFVKAVLPHGTATVITDPHEIANVLGTDGIDYMIQATEGLPVEVRFMLPSCVPATPWEHSGAVIDAEAMKEPITREGIAGLGEFMCDPGGYRSPSENRSCTQVSLQDRWSCAGTFRQGTECLCGLRGLFGSRMFIHGGSPGKTQQRAVYHDP